jgi:hypothetical protein
VYLQGAIGPPGQCPRFLFEVVDLLPVCGIALAQADDFLAANGKQRAGIGEPLHRVMQVTK